MKRFLLLFSFLLFTGVASAEKITVDGKEYPDAEMIETSQEGVVFQVVGGEEPEFVTLPWKELTETQKTAVKAKLQSKMLNSLYHARYVKGTVFHADPRAGIIIQIDTDAPKGGSGYQDGAKIITSGLVLIKDLPSSVSRSEGAVIDIIAYDRGTTYDFDMGIAKKTIPYLTVARPLWGREQQWINVDGQKMAAKFIAMREGKVLFEKAGKQFIYELAKLDADGQARVKEYQAKIGDFPIP